MDQAPASPTYPEYDGVHEVAVANVGRAILKRRRGAPEGFFTAEARGLEALRSANALRVPDVYEQGDDFIVLEDLGRGHADDEFFVQAGAGLARLHQQVSEQFGFDDDGWCGDSRQSNARDDDGWRFFAEARLLPQARRALDGGHIERTDMTAVESICASLRERVPEQPASLVHGDLWLGNLHCCASGEPALIDAAAVHYGWAEADLAMLTLFGSVPHDVFDSYAEHRALAADWRDRIPLYNLYHLLNHLNLFGKAYLSAVRASLERYR